MKILLIDNNVEPECWGAGDLRRYTRLAEGATVHIRRGPPGDLPRSLAGYDRVIASGSATSVNEDAPWVEAEMALIRQTVDAGIPFLGVCYGHQLLARALGGKPFVRQAARAEFGWTRILVDETAPLLTGLPREFYSFSSHFDEIAQLPPGLKRLARSEDCSIQACQLEGKPIFGIQFHPEKNLEDASRTFAERREKGTPERLLHPNRSQELYDPIIADTLFGNFFAL